jgi:hypothetical protein
VKCLKCGKAISRLAETVNGLQQIGPVCAKDSGIALPKVRQRKIKIVVPLVVDESQLDLFGQKNPSEEGKAVNG